MYCGVREKIIDELRSMGYNFSHIGTTYLIETIEIIYNSQNPKLFHSIEKTVYEMLAEKHSKKANTIKSNITKATNYMCDQALLNRKQNNDSYYNMYTKLTPKNVINTVILKLSA